MKTLLRTLVILAAALLVVAALFAFRQTSYGQSLASAGHDRGGWSQEAGSPGTTTSSRPPPTGFGERGGESHGPNLFAAVELLKNLAIVAVSVTLIALGAWMVRRGRREKQRPLPPEPL
jgi:hypothetical protein